jgi:GNAT superfamily N-acetyltransferase
MAVVIIPFEERYAPDFKRLNIEWLLQYFTVEPYDEYQLSNPVTAILDKNGFIFLALEDSQVIGTVALMRETDRSYELTKMSVTASRQGRGVSKLLLDQCLELAKQKNWRRLFLYSNTKLVPAIALYRRYGFEEIPLESDSHYQRTNIKMELKTGND